MLRPSLFVIHDRIELKHPRELQWNLHTYGKIREVVHSPNLKLQLIDGEQSLQLLCILPEKAQWRTGYSDFVPAYPHAGERDRFLQLQQTGKYREFLIVMSLDLSPINWEVQPASDKNKNRMLALQINGRQARIELA